MVVWACHHILPVIGQKKLCVISEIIISPTWPEDEEPQSGSDQGWAVHLHLIRITGAHLENF